MSDLHNLKKRILMDIRQRTQSTPHDENKLTTDVHEKKIARSPRLGSKRFHLTGVFKTTKDDSNQLKQTTTKENSKRTKSCKVPSTQHHYQKSPNFKNHRKEYNQVLKEQDKNSNDIDTYNKSGSRESLLSLPGEIKIALTPTKKGFTKSLKKFKWDKNKLTIRKKTSDHLLTGSEEEESITIQFENGAVPLYTEPLKDNSSDDCKKYNQNRDHLQPPLITRSLSDTSHDRSNDDCIYKAEETVLLRHSGSVKTAKLRRSNKLTREEKLLRRVSESDFTRYKKIYRKINTQNTSTMPRKSNKNVADTNMNFAKTHGQSHPFSLLKTKIVEEAVQEDGTVTLRKDVDNQRNNKTILETDRDSGVEMENTHTSTRLSSCETNEHDGVIEYEEAQDSAISDDAKTQHFDFSTLTRSKSTDNVLVSNPNPDDCSTLTRRSSLQDQRTIQPDNQWDMSKLIKRFDTLEWDLSPALNLKLETLDLDHCDLEEIPHTVPEIEYYALREVQAVSLNHNSKIKTGDMLGKLADLRAINMWGCGLERIPPNWSTLTKIQMLGLGNNKNLINFGPLKHLTNIIWLDLGGCGLKSIPNEITNMMKLRVLALGKNPGLEIKDELCCLWDLKKLGLNDCDLQFIPKSVFSLHKLTHLHLDNNNIRTIGQEIVQLKDLVELTVTGNSEISFPKLLSQCESIDCIIVDEQKDLTRVSNTLRQRIQRRTLSSEFDLEE